MMDCGFVPGDQSLVPTKTANQNLVHKTRHIPCLGTTPSACSTDRRTSCGCANLNKALYCRILWLIGISSSVEPKKTFHLVPKPRRSCCLLKTTPLPTPQGGLAATPPVRTKNQGKCCCPYVSGPQTLILGPCLLGEAALPPNRSAASGDPSGRGCSPSAETLVTRGDIPGPRSSFLPDQISNLG